MKENRNTDKLFGIKLLLRPIASLAVVALMMSTLFWGCNSAVSHEDLFARNFESYKMLLPKRATYDTLPDTKLFNQAIAEYEAKEFAAAAESFKRLSEINKESRAYPYYAAHAYLASGKPVESIPYFQQLLDSPRLTPVVHQARWFMALAHLHSKNIPLAKEQLKSVSEGKYKYAEAQELLKQL